MSKRIKGLIQDEYNGEFKDLDAVAVINPRGIEANATNTLRGELAKSNIRMRVVKNTLARRAADETSLDGFDRLLDGPSALVYSTDENTGISNVARALMDAKKTLKTIEFRGVFFDGDVYEGEAGVDQISKFPTREEAIADILGCALAPAANLAGCVSAPGGNIAGILKTHIKNQGGDDDA